MLIDPYTNHVCPKGINKLRYAVLQALWWDFQYVSNFTIHTQGRV